MQQHHGGHHRYGPQSGVSQPPGTHRTPVRAGPRGPDPYYNQDQTGKIIIIYITLAIYIGYVISVLFFCIF